MALQFTIDPATGVVQPPVTVFNGGSQVTTGQRGGKRKTRKSKKSRKAKKTMHKRR